MIKEGRGKNLSLERSPAMKIQEVELKTGLERGNIRFYEKMGLLCPVRRSNGYREYSDEDVRTLLRVRLMRQLDIPLEEIARMQRQPEQLAEVLTHRMETVRQESLLLERTQEVCKAIRDAGIRYDQLEPEQWLRQMDRPAEQGQSLPPSPVRRDVVPIHPHPWRRFLARWLDLELCRLALEVLLYLVLNLYPLKNFWFEVLDYLFSVGALLLVEPILLSRWGTTPGKFLLRLRVTNLTGGKLTLSQARERTKGVFFRGVGLFLPVYSLYRNYRSYRSCGEGEPLDWEEASCCVASPLPLWRCAAFGLAFLMMIPLGTLLSLQATLPKQRQPLTMAAYAQNFNDMREHFLPDYRYEMSDAGELTERPSDSQGTVIIEEEDLFPHPVTECRYTMEGEFLTAIELTVTVDGGAEATPVAYGAEDQILLSTLAFVGARKELSPLTGGLIPLTDRMTNDPLESYEYTIAGVRVRRQVESSGYVGVSGLLFPREDVSAPYFHLRYTLELL